MWRPVVLPGRIFSEGWAEVVRIFAATSANRRKIVERTQRGNHMQRHASHDGHRTQYVLFGLMMALSYLLMFGFMYAMVDRLSEIYPNLNQAYMTGLMVAPMAALEILLMNSMYPDKKLNVIIIAVSAALLMICWFGIRDQWGVGDKSFLRSMIPHHSGAVLMYRKASIEDAEIKKLCAQIVSGQNREIDQMRNILARLK